MRNAHADRKTTNSNKEAAAQLWEQYCAEYPNADDHLRDLIARLGDSIHCQWCGSNHYKEEEGMRDFECRDCHKKSWYSAGTLFEKVKHLGAWLFFIDLRDRDIVVSVASFSRLVGVSHDCAWNIDVRVSKVIDDAFEDDSLSVPTSEFARIFVKRSRETPARAHPIAEQEEAEGRQESTQVDDFQNQTPPADLSPFERRLYDEITDVPIHYDVLCERSQLGFSMGGILMMLQLKGLVTKLHGDLYKRTAAKPPEASWLANGEVVKDDELQDRISSIIAGAMEFMRTNFHGVSRKYLQLHLCKFWQYVDKERWCRGALVKACLRHGYIRNEEIRRYVSPLLAHVCRTDVVLALV